jgi:hypothetical protein
MRRLRCTRRHVPLDMIDEYMLAWLGMKREIEGRGGRAWLFRSAEHDDQFHEFVEWSGEVTSPMEDEGVADGLLQLDAFGQGTTGDEWEELA